MVYNFFDEKHAVHTETRINSNAFSEKQQLLKELHKPIIRKYKECKALSSYRDNIWGTDLADMRLTS